LCVDKKNFAAKLLFPKVFAKVVQFGLTNQMSCVSLFAERIETTSRETIVKTLGFYKYKPFAILLIFDQRFSYLFF